MPWSMSTLGKNIKLHEMKNEKKLHGFSYYKDMANFEAFLWSIKLSANLLLLKSAIDNKVIEGQFVLRPKGIARLLHYFSNFRALCLLWEAPKCLTADIRA